jgi:hypothetical protein
MQFLGKFAFAAALLACCSAYAQRGAASKAAGDYNFYSNAGGTSVGHALDYAYDYQQYVQDAPTVDPTIASEQSTAISNSISRAKKHFSQVRKQTNNPETLATLDTIDGHLNDAETSHNEMVEKNNGEVSPETTQEHLNRTVESLQKAMNTHQNMTGNDTPVNKN